MVDSNVAECPDCGRLVNNTVNRRCPSCQADIPAHASTTDRDL